jgi:hypothetical protein
MRHSETLRVGRTLYISPREVGRVVEDLSLAVSLIAGLAWLTNVL